MGKANLSSREGPYYTNNTYSREQNSFKNTRISTTRTTKNKRANLFMNTRISTTRDQLLDTNYAHNF